MCLPLRIGLKAYCHIGPLVLVGWAVWAKLCLTLIKVGLVGGTLHRITSALLAAILLIISVNGICVRSVTAAEPSPIAFESLLAYAPSASAEIDFPLPTQRRLSRISLAGEQLFQELHKASAPRKAPAPGYKQAKSYMYSKVDNVNCDGAPGILTFYSEVCVAGSSDNGNDYKEQGDQNRDGVVDKIVNAEHIWPQSYFKSALPMLADLHQLAPTLETPNGRRGNLRFAVVSKSVYSTSCGSKLGKEGFEPCDPEKGNVARAMLYFIVRYYDHNIRQGMDYDNFWTSRVPMLLKWNRQDPPDSKEKRRNDLVEAFQGNRNPFIDDPSLADQIGVEVFAAH